MYICHVWKWAQKFLSILPVKIGFLACQEEVDNCSTLPGYPKLPVFIRKLHYIFETSFFWFNSPQWARASSFTRFLDHTQRCTTVGRNPLDEWSARRRDLHLTTHKTGRYACPHWDSNPQSQQASGGRPTILNWGFSILLCARVMVFFIWPSLHNSVVQCFYYATIKWATCFDPTRSSSGCIK